jgi:group I intron endonuclease
MGNYSLNNLQTNISITNTFNPTGIYKITSPTNSVYIGQSRRIRNRWYHYTTKHFKNQERLYRSIMKHGVTTHQFELIHELPKDVSKFVLDTYEVFYIEFYKGVGIDLLNLRNGGISSGVHSEETREKIRKALTGKKLSQDHIESLRRAHKGVELSEGHKESLRSAIKKIPKEKRSYWLGKKMPKEIRDKMSQSRIGKMLGFKHSEETKRKISESRKGIFPTDEQRKNISSGMMGRKFSESTRNKLSLASKGRKRMCGELSPMFGRTGENHPKYGVKVSDDTKLKLRNAMLGKKHKPESIELMRKVKQEAAALKRMVK